MNIHMKELKIGDLKARIPIIQGGMGVAISLSGLACAVADQGGIGVISAAGIGMIESDFHTNFIEANNRALRNEIRKAREKTKGIIGVNIMVALTNYSELVKTSVEEEIDIIFSGAGLPLDLPKYLGESRKTKLVPIVSSARAAKIISKRWIEKYDYVPDAIVVEGPKAGGHLGFREDQLDKQEYTIENIVTEVIKEMSEFEEKSNRKIPVIAAGGIYTGEDILYMMKLGVAGVQMATRFVTTKECDASDAFKESYINSKKEDIGIIKSPIGLPGRAIMNDFLVDVKAGEKKPYKCPYHCIITCDYQNSPYCIALALMNAKKGSFGGGFAFAGVNAYKTTEIVSVSDLIKTIKAEYTDSVREEMKRTAKTEIDLMRTRIKKKRPRLNLL